MHLTIAQNGQHLQQAGLVKVGLEPKVTEVITFTDKLMLKTVRPARA